MLGRFGRAQSIFSRRLRLIASRICGLRGMEALGANIGVDGDISTQRVKGRLKGAKIFSKPPNCRWNGKYFDGGCVLAEGQTVIQKRSTGRKL